MRVKDGGGHGPLGLFVCAQREPEHFGQVTSALIGGHGPTDFGEVLEHADLALGTEAGQFAHQLSGAGTEVGRGGQFGFQLGLFGGDFGAPFAALGQVAFVEKANPLQSV